MRHATEISWQILLLPHLPSDKIKHPRIPPARHRQDSRIVRAVEVGAPEQDRRHVRLRVRGLVQAPPLGQPRGRKARIHLAPLRRHHRQRDRVAVEPQPSRYSLLAPDR